jgi:hypothetical protein
MLENMTTGEKALIGATAIGIAALVFHKPTRNAVGLSDGKRDTFYTVRGRENGKWNIRWFNSLKEAKDYKKTKHEDYPNNKYSLRKHHGKDTVRKR